MPQLFDVLKSTQDRIEGHLRDILDQETARGTPDGLSSALRHAVLGGGKRFRPFLVLETARLFDVPVERALNAAAAVELIHCYSLVHDDLPSMDNDALRRGQPTVWKAFGEWTAILAGDALQSLAYQILGSQETHPLGQVRAELVLALAKAAGPAGMVGGQALDLEAESALRPADVAHVAKLQSMKTGQLIVASCELGAILGEASKAQRDALARYGECLGLAFQISDDLLDAEGSTATVGKATGKDSAAGKATLVSLLGADQARANLNQVISDAEAALASFSNRAGILKDAARFLGQRAT